MDQLELPISIKLTNPKPVDYYYGPYPDIATALSLVPLAIRHVGRKVFITGLGEYSWVYGTSDPELIPIGSYMPENKEILRETNRSSLTSSYPPATYLNYFGYAESSEGTQWLPGTIGGSYYPSGIYISNGVNWVSDRNAIAQQLQVNIDDIDQIQLDLLQEISDRISGDNALQLGKADVVHTHVKANITDFNDADYATAAQGVLADSALQAETDPIFAASPSFGILASDINDWDDAFSWGDHALAGYLTSIPGTYLQSGDNVSELVNDSGYLVTETDPVYQASEAANFVAGDKSNLDNQSGINTGDETTITIQTKRPLRTIEGQSIEGVGNIDLSSSDVGLGNVDNIQQYPATNPSGFETPVELTVRDTANRDRSNHTGTQLAATISDFDAEVTNNSAVAANTAKISADGSVTTHSDVTDAGSGEIITAQERTDINASIGVHDDVDLTGVVINSNAILKYDGSDFVPVNQILIEAPTLLLNSSNTPQDIINVPVNVQRLVKHKITINYAWSFNSAANDFVAEASFGGADIAEGLTNNDEIHRQEPKDPGGASPDGRGTNQVYSFYRRFFITPTVLGNNQMILQFFSGDNNNIAACWNASIEIEEIL